jgi:hypothetical protein
MTNHKTGSREEWVAARLWTLKVMNLTANQNLTNEDVLNSASRLSY